MLEIKKRNLIFLLITNILIINSFQNKIIAQAPALGTTSTYVLFTAAGALTNIGTTLLTGDIGSNLGAFTGSPSVIGQTQIVNAASSQAATDLAIAYNNLNAVNCETVLGTPFGNYQLLTPGIYCQNTAASLNGDLILDGQCDSNALFIIKINGALSTNTNSTITLINSASIKNVYWLITGAFNIGVNSTFKGTAIASGAISILAGSIIKGQALTTAGQISTNTNIATRFQGSVWTGINGSDYSKAANWSYNLVPDSGENISFATNAMNDCVLDANHTIGNIVNTSTKNLVLNGFDCNIIGSISQTSSGKIDASKLDSKLIMAGCLSQTISADVLTSNTLQNLTINNSSGVKIEGPLSLINLLKINNGTLITGDFLTLKSTSTGTAGIASISNGDITGNVKVERFISAQGRRFRFLSSPCAGITLADWQKEIHITGTGGSTNGFDSTLSNNPSVYTYNESIIDGDLNTGWIAATNTKDNVVIGKGYRVFIRGPRSENGLLDGTNNTQDEVTMVTLGMINKGDIIMSPTFSNSGTLINDGWNMLGNPYPSAYNWSAFHNTGRIGLGPDYTGTNYTNIDATIYIFDATSNSYKSYNAVAQSGTLMGGIIPSGSAFFVKATAIAPAITFKEEYKTTTKPIDLYKTLNSELRIKLISDSNDYDEYIFKLADGSTKNKDAFDISKIQNKNTNISSYGEDDVDLSLSTYPFIQNNDVISLTINSTKTFCTLAFNNIDNFALNYDVFLRDNFEKTITNIRLINTLVFKVETAENTQLKGKRFELIFNKNTTGTIAKQEELNPMVKISPNPVSEFLNVETCNLQSNLYSWVIYGIYGDIINSGNCNQIEQSISTSNLSKGSYYIQFLSENFKHVEKFIK